MKNTKIFLTGTSRGGTSLVAKMLNANKDISVSVGLLMEILRLKRNLVLNRFDKKKYLFKFTSKLPFQDFYYSDESIKILDLIINDKSNLKLPKKIWKKHLNIIKKRASFEESKDLVNKINKKVYHPNFAKMINNCFQLVKTTRKLKKEKIIGILDSWIVEMFLPLAKLFKNSKFIVIIRDPRASISSNLKVKNKQNIANTLSFIKSWRKMIALVIYYKTLKIFKNRLHIVVHEDLVRNPKKICKKICKFLNVKFENKMLNTKKYINYSTGKTWSGGSNFEKKAFGFSTRRTNRWKNKLSYIEIKAIEFIAHHEMKLLNYRFYKNDNFSKLKNGLSFLIEGDKKKRKWKTDSKRIEFNYGAEFFRNYLFDIKSVGKDKSLVRRLFLFKEVYDKIMDKKPIFRSSI